MARWQRLAETNPSASPEQKVLMGLMVIAELENTSSPVDSEFEQYLPVTSTAGRTQDPNQPRR